MTARFAIEQGIWRASIGRRDEAVVFITLTDTSEGKLDFPGLYEKTAGMRKWLQRNWGMREYLGVVELQDRMALHPHIFAEVDRSVVEDLRDWKTRSSYRRRRHELQPAAERLGFGQMVDARTINVQANEVAKVGQYGAKALSAYATKESAKRFKEAGAKRIRPVRLSRGWYSGGLEAARSHVMGLQDEKHRDPGPWLHQKAILDAA